MAGKSFRPSSTSSSIIFADQDESTGLDTIWTMDIDGGDLTQIVTDPQLDCLQPAPQPGGPLVAYLKQDPDGGPQTRDIYIFDTDNGLSQQLKTNISRDDMPRWSSDGESLYFRSTRGLAWAIWRAHQSFREVRQLLSRQVSKVRKDRLYESLLTKALCSSKSNAPPVPDEAADQPPMLLVEVVL